MNYWGAEHNFYSQLSMTLGLTYSFVTTIKDMENYVVPMTNALFMTIPQVSTGGVIQTMGLLSDIPSLTTYTKLAIPAFTGTASLGGQTSQSDTFSVDLCTFRKSSLDW